LTSSFKFPRAAPPYPTKSEQTFSLSLGFSLVNFCRRTRLGNAKISQVFLEKLFLKFRAKALPKSHDLHCLKINCLSRPLRLASARKSEYFSPQSREKYSHFC
jgi:hypothetical protein